ncbi:MAG: hypothetical protein U9R07_11805 [Pseudomonadota bacterium]|nr:hypothetical protein [Pseudomonadota bacterium]
MERINLAIELMEAVIASNSAAYRMINHVHFKGGRLTGKEQHTLYQLQRLASKSARFMLEIAGAQWGSDHDGFRDYLTFAGVKTTSINPHDCPMALTDSWLRLAKSRLGKEQRNG